MSDNKSHQVSNNWGKMKIVLLQVGMLIGHNWGDYKRCRIRGIKSIIPYKYGLYADPRLIDWAYVGQYDNINNNSQLGPQSAFVEQFDLFVPHLFQYIYDNEDYDIEVIVRTTDRNNSGVQYAVNTIDDTSRRAVAPGFKGNRFGDTYKSIVSNLIALRQVVDRLDIRCEVMDTRDADRIEAWLLRQPITPTPQEKLIDEIVSFD